jgi:hypothetical protein
VVSVPSFKGPEYEIVHIVDKSAQRCCAKPHIVDKFYCVLRLNASCPDLGGNFPFCTAERCRGG